MIRRPQLREPGFRRLGLELEHGAVQGSYVFHAALDGEEVFGAGEDGFVGGSNVGD